MKISSSIISKAYDVAQKVYEKKISLTEGAKILSTEGLNTNSAKDYINNFRYLIDGKRFTRTLNAESMKYYFAKIKKEYNHDVLNNAVKSLGAHIEYYEGIQNNKTKLYLMRSIYNKYLGALTPTSLIETQDDLNRNIDLLEKYLIEGTDHEKSEALSLIKKGICFIAYYKEGEVRFAPSRFIGYKNNTINIHKHSLTINGRETNVAINSILGFAPKKNNKLEKLYCDFCFQLGITSNEKGAFGVIRKFWSINLDEDVTDSVSYSQSEFPEGKIIERIHKYRERNPKVLELAKQKFKEKYGKLFCQVCKFDFEKKYGEIGKDFIEGHHTIPVSEMSPNYKTQPSEIAILCSNCHRMVHRKRPWLKMEDLSKLIIK